jgi:hypothetical protein
MYFSLMDDERFRQLLETARRAFNTKGDNVMGGGSRSDRLSVDVTLDGATV